MTLPRFSVVIPTKNRPAMLREAIQSALLQDISDVEVIISDNFNDDETRQSVAMFAGDERVRHIRTDRELNMPDHWEFATKHARGEYVFILTDRSLFRAGALKRVAGVIDIHEAQGIKAYTWSHSLYDYRKKVLRPVTKDNGEVTISRSEELIKHYAKNGRVDWRFPVLPNGCYHRSIAETIRKNHGRMFAPIAPDGVGDFLILSYTEKIAAINEGLLIAQNAADSNGAATMTIGPEGYLNTLNMAQWCRRVPIKVPFIQNINFDDFLSVRTMVVGEELAMADVDWANYFLRCYEEYAYFSRRGFIKNRKKEFLDEWERALNAFDPAVQSRVKACMGKIKLKFGVKAMLANSPILPPLRRMQSRLNGGRSIHYPTALEAAGF